MYIRHTQVAFNTQLFPYGVGRPFQPTEEGLNLFYMNYLTILRPFQSCISWLNVLYRMKILGRCKGRHFTGMLCASSQTTLSTHLSRDLFIPAEAMEIVERNCAPFSFEFKYSLHSFVSTLIDVPGARSKNSQKKKLRY